VGVDFALAAGRSIRWVAETFSGRVVGRVFVGDTGDLLDELKDGSLVHTHVAASRRGGYGSGGDTPVS
jgi:hypothetical protein